MYVEEKIEKVVFKGINKIEKVVFRIEKVVFRMLVLFVSCYLRIC